MTDADGPPDPQLDPSRSLAMGADIEGLDDIEVSRDDVTIGEADPSSLTAADTEPVADEEPCGLLRDLETGGATDRKRAALALTDRERTEAAVGALSRAARGDDDAEVRQFAVEALGELGGERAREAAVACLEDDDPWVRAEAVVALDHLDRVAYESVIEYALSDDHHAVRRNAAVSLFKTRGEGLLDVLLEQSRDDSERVREWAAHLLAGIDDARAEQRLAELADDESEPKIVSSTAARALDVDSGTFRRQFTGGTGNDSNEHHGGSRLNHRPDL